MPLKKTPKIDAPLKRSAWQQAELEAELEAMMREGERGPEGERMRLLDLTMINRPLSDAEAEEHAELAERYKARRAENLRAKRAGKRWDAMTDAQRAPYAPAGRDGYIGMARAGIKHKHRASVVQREVDRIARWSDKKKAKRGPVLVELELMLGIWNARPTKKAPTTDKESETTP